MRVLQLSTARTWRGGEQQIEYLHLGLLAENVDSILMIPRDSEMHRRYGADKSIRFSFRFSLDPLNVYAVLRVIRLQKIDLIHVHDSHAHTIVYLASLLGMTTPVVVHRRVIFPIKEKWMNIRKYNHTNIKSYICVSKNVKEVLSKAIRSHIPVHTIYSSIEPNRLISKSPVDIHHELALAKDQKIVAHIGAVTPDKDYDTWLRAAQLVYNDRKDIHFLAFGRISEQMAYLFDLVAHLKLEHRVHFLGFKENLIDYLPSIDLLMFSSKSEGLGSSILDAFASRIPVSATDAGGIPELITHRQTGMLASVGNYNQLAKNSLTILNDEKLRRQMIRAAYEKQKEFHIDKMIRKTRQLYHNILKNKS